MKSHSRTCSPEPVFHKSVRRHSTCVLGWGLGAHSPGKGQVRVINVTAVRNNELDSYIETYTDPRCSTE